MPMLGYYTPAELAQLFGKGESTYRQQAAKGEYLNAVKQGNTWFIPLSDVSKTGRGYDQEFAPSMKLSPEYPNDSTDVVLAQNSDGRYGVYLEDAWYGAAQALVMLNYLQQHRDWLAEKAQANKEAEESGQPRKERDDEETVHRDR